MNERTIKDLEVDKIFKIIESYSISDSGKRLLNPSSITFDIDVINRRSSKIERILHLLSESDAALSYFVSLDNILNENKKSSYSFDTIDIYNVGSFLSSLRVLGSFLKESLVDNDLIKLEKEISISISKEGFVKETHPELLPYIKKLEEIKFKRQSYSSSFISKHTDIVQNLNALYKNERVVLPIKKEYKNQVMGFVQGSSTSGSTLFIEPFELVELNNQVVLAEEEIIKVKQRIIQNLSREIYKIIPYLREMDSFVTDFDFHYSLSLFIKNTNSKRVIQDNRINIIDARHPLLYKKAVPISLELSESIKAVVLSGANAGGKTVSMKTIALFCILNQIMGFAPLREGSTLPIFKNIYTDIGDGQSISENFSTFSHHMANLSYILKNANKDSLILLDELGSGTDPQEGSALTIAVLKYLVKKDATLFITSHYNEVKLFAYNEKGYLNASMEFDEESDNPTFRIIPGLPGESHAIAIAKRMGVIKEVIKDAKESLIKQGSVSKLINDLNSKNKALDRKITSLECERRALLKKENEVESIKKSYDEKLSELLSADKRELSSFLNESRKKLERLIKDISTGKLDKEKTKSVKSFIKDVEDKEKEVTQIIQKQNDDELDRIDLTFSVGEEVLCGSFERRGTILKVLDKNKYLVSLDNIKITLTKKDLKKCKKEDIKPSSVYQVERVKPVIVMDVRGKTLNEVLSLLDTQIEGCLLYNLSSFSIIHGYGDGILSRGVHEYLKKQRSVKSYYFAHPEDGGMGKTYVFFD